jgi:hypothetical protein
MIPRRAVIRPDGSVPSLEVLEVRDQDEDRPDDEGRDDLESGTTAGWIAARALTCASITSHVLEGGASPSRMPTIRPSEHHRDAVADREDPRRARCLTIRIAAPASRCSTIRLWMYSIEPTSSRASAARDDELDRAGELAATTTFCWLPPTASPRACGSTASGCRSPDADLSRLADRLEVEPTPLLYGAR